MLKRANNLYTKERNTLLLDFDGVLAPYNKEFIETWIRHGLHKLSREIAMKEPFRIPSEDTAINEIRAKEITKSALKHIVFKRKNTYFEQFGLSQEEMLQKVRENMLEDPNYLNRELTELRDAMTQSQKNGLRIVITSHSDRATIKERLKRMGLSELFKEEDIIDCIDLGGHKKDEGTKAYKSALAICSVPAEHAMTVDDSKGNLLRAKELGIQTVAIAKSPLHRIKHSLKAPSFADRHHSNVLEFFTAYNQEIKTGHAYTAPNEEVSALRR